MYRHERKCVYDVTLTVIVVVYVIIFVIVQTVRLSSTGRLSSTNEQERDVEHIQNCFVFCPAVKSLNEILKIGSLKVHTSLSLVFRAFVVNLIFIFYTYCMYRYTISTFLYWINEHLPMTPLCTDVLLDFRIMFGIYPSL